MGTTYSDEDMSTTHYAAVFEGKIIGTDEGTATLVLSPREGQASAYSKLEMVIDKALGLPIEVRFFNVKGQHVKTESRGAYDCGSDICTPGEMKMVDHRRNDVWTTLVVDTRKVNTGVADSTFSVRNLERGR